MELVSKMTVIAFGVGVICFICNMAYNYLYHGVSQPRPTPNEDKFPDMMQIAAAWCDVLSYLVQANCADHRRTFYFFTKKRAPKRKETTSMPTYS